MILSQASAAPEHSAAFDLRDRGLLLADGIFDTSLVIDGGVVLEAAHLNRLMDAAQALQIPVERTALARVMREAVTGVRSGALRITVTRGAGARGLTGQGDVAPTLLAAVTPYDASTPPEPARVMESEILRNPTSVTARYKTLSYTDNVVALRDAEAAGFDDVFFFTPDGHLSCASVANVFVQTGTDIITPPVSDGALPGVMRNWLLSHGQLGGWALSERRVTRADLRSAEHVFLTNSLRLFQPVAAFGATSFGPDLPAGLDGLRRQLLSR